MKMILFLIVGGFIGVAGGFTAFKLASKPETKRIFPEPLFNYLLQEIADPESLEELHFGKPIFVTNKECFETAKLLIAVNEEQLTLIEKMEESQESLERFGKYHPIDYRQNNQYGAPEKIEAFAVFLMDGTFIGIRETASEADKALSMAKVGDTIY